LAILQISLNIKAFQVPLKVWICWRYIQAYRCRPPMKRRLHEVICGCSVFFQHFDHRPVLLVNHPAVKLPKLGKHSLVLFFCEVVPNCREKDFVLFLDVVGVEFSMRAKSVGNIRQGRFITVPITRVGLYKRPGRLPCKHVVFNQFLHNLLVFS
jgi:hypothetical protein